MYGKIKQDLASEIEQIRQSGLYKEERYLHTPQGADISVEYPADAPQQEVLNFCANNYLGLSSHPKVIAAAKAGLDERGLACRRSDSSAARRTYTRSWKRGCLNF